MNQRKCGTCKYFEEGGIASSGWCKHPERQEIEHMVLVRKTELACRTGWDDDLWEPREGGLGTGKEKVGQRPRANRAVTEGHSFPAASGDGGADVLLDAETDTISRRRELQRVGQRSSSDVEPQNEPSTAFSSLDAWSSSFDPGNQHEDVATDELQDETVSPRFGAVRGEWQGQLRDLSEQRTRSAETILAPSVFPVRSENGADDQGRSDIPENGVHHEPVAQDETRPDEPQRVQQSGLTEQFEFDPETARQQSAGFGVQGADLEPESGESEERSQSVEDDPAEPRQLPILAGATACCRNCRDFIPAKDGLRGWCNNPFAFEKRQEVNGDTVACQSTFGSWWSPSDDWWMERADIAHHSAPTPLVDNLIRQIRTRAVDEDGSTEMRERS